jgi:hypothetical protein
VNRASQEFLAGARLTCNQDGHVGRRDTPHAVKNLTEYRRVPDDSVDAFNWIELRHAHRFHPNALKNARQGPRRCRRCCCGC